MSEIPRTTLPTDRAAFDALVAKAQPLVFEGAIADWPATKEWTLDYLKRKVGDRETIVSVSPNPLFQGNPETGHYTPDQLRKMRFGDFLDTIAADAPGDRHLYAHKQPLADVFPELRADLDVPPVLRDRALQLVTMWMGPRGSITQLHHDGTDNLFAMIRGRKRVRLFDPYQDADFQRFPFKRLNGRSSWHLSAVGSSFTADWSKFPGFERARYVEAVMHPGDMLFIPNFWWHEVESLDQPSISLAYWWSDRPDWANVEQALARITALAEEYAAADPAWRKFIEHLFEKEVFGRARTR